MAITTYAQLVSAIQRWLIDDDLNSSEGDFIVLAEAEMNKRLAKRPVAPMRATTSLSVSTTSVTAPTDMLRAESLLFSTANVCGYVTADQMDELRGDVTPEFPAFFTVIGANIVFMTAPTAASTGRLTYFQRLPALVSAANWMLTAHPDVYLYGSLAAACGFIDDPEKQAKYEALFDNAMNGVWEAYPTPSNRAPLRSDLATVAGWDWRR